MESNHLKRRRSLIVASTLIAIGAAALVLFGIAALTRIGRETFTSADRTDKNSTKEAPRQTYQPRRPMDTSGYVVLGNFVKPWQPNASLEVIRDIWNNADGRAIEEIDARIASDENMPLIDRLRLLHWKAMLLNNGGDPTRAYSVLEHARSLTENSNLARQVLYSEVYMLGVTALRLGENENCIMCRGESSCILPISAAARHTHPKGSRLAIQHFTEYLDQFPDDLEVRWLLNIAHMTLGEHPDQVDARFLVPLDHFQRNEFDIGRFRDIGHIVGVNQFTQAGGAIMDDFDNDELLDIAVTTFDPTTNMQLLVNTGQGTFEDRSSRAGLTGQLGGLNCVQTDYNNDGRLDIYVVRGAWLPHPVRPSLLRNDGDGVFTDVTAEARLLDPVNSIAASWADYDNDGWLDLFVCCERQPSRLYRNRADGTFEDVTAKAGIDTGLRSDCKGAAWIDYDNDGYPELFLNYLTKVCTQFFRNNRDGTFQEITAAAGIDGPQGGFSCWTWDYDNDGWLDLFATCYDRSLGDVVKGLLGRPHERNSNRLYRNVQGQRFEDMTAEAGLDLVLCTMGSNFGDFDNDGFLDMYLGTGEPDLATLVPNRMFKNVAGQRFAEITASSGTGNLQKGHGVSCGDWDRDGNVDVFIQMGGAVNGDKYHNILFQNPGHDNNWVTLKLTGKKTNRAAIGARIKVVTAGDHPQEVHRLISSGSSFGANPLQQTIGLGKADRIATLEIHWPTSGTTQVFRDVAVNQAIAVTEFAEDYRKLDWKPIAIPAAN